MARNSSRQRRSALQVLQAISMMVTCRNQADTTRCGLSCRTAERKAPGWLKDKFGRSWQIVSPDWNDMLREKDPARAERVMEAILTMPNPIWRRSDRPRARNPMAGRFPSLTEAAHQR